MAKHQPTALVRFGSSELPAFPAPKPSKREIIAAMLIRARQHHQDEGDRVEKLMRAVRPAFDKRLRALALEILQDSIEESISEELLQDGEIETPRANISLGSPLNYYLKPEKNVCVSISAICITDDPELKRAAAACAAAAKGHPGRFDEDATKKLITASLDTCNPQRLLDDAAASRVIDGLLDQMALGKPKRIGAAAATVNV